MFTFHKTVRGYLHIINERECEDYSDSFSNEEKNYHIVVVADGHGANECFRSAVGAKLAVETAIKYLKEIAENENINEENLCLDSNYRKKIIRELTDKIVKDWHNSVIEEFKQNPITEEESDFLKKNNLDIDKITKEIPHIYGTTLIAGLMNQRYIILIQQGDGRCDVFYRKDGITKVRQPIPWDNRCEYNITTSMCDVDVAEKIRSTFIDLNKIKVIACYFGSDGVEDAYRDTYDDLGGSHSIMAGVHTFFKNISCQIAEQNQNDFKNYLENMLPEFSQKGLFSKTGSGDDVSIAGIVNIEELKKNIDNFKNDIEIYDLEEKLFVKNDELKGKTRKHNILKHRLIEAKEAQDKNKYKEAAENFREYDEIYKNIQNEIEKIEEQIKNLNNHIYKKTDESIIQKEIDKEPKEIDKEPKEIDKEPKEIDKEPKEIDEEPKETDKEPKETDKEPKETDKEPKEIDKELKEIEKEPKEIDKEKAQKDFPLIF